MKKYKDFVISILVVALTVSIAFNITFSAKTKNAEKVVSASSAQGASNSTTAPSSNSPEEPNSPQVPLFLKDIENQVDGFLEILYTYDSNRADISIEDEYVGYITEDGDENMEGYLSRYRPYNKDERLKIHYEDRSIYVTMISDEKAEVLCLVNSIRERDFGTTAPDINFDLRLIRIDVLFIDNVWLVDYMHINVSISLAYVNPSQLF